MRWIIRCDPLLRGAPRRGALAVAAVLLVAASAHAESFPNLKPANPQPASDALAPGLAVEYASIMVRHVDELAGAGNWRKGPPLTALKYKSGGGAVLTSGENDGVGARIKGFIKFDKNGRYLLATQSNDGVRVRLGGSMVVNDPGVHPDQFSENAELMISQPGWYPLEVLYFERKNTSTLELYWQPPEASEFAIVPAEAFANLK